MRALALPALLAVLLLGALAQPSAAETSFSGSCTYDDWAQFWPPQKLTPAPSGYYARGTGNCKGTLNGAPFDGPSTYEAYADMSQQSSCEIGSGTNMGPGYIRFVTGRATASSAPQRPPSQAVRRSRKRSKHRRHTTKRAHRAASTRRESIRAASSDPPRYTSQPDPHPPAPTSPDPMLAVWIDQVTAAPNLLAQELHGAYRGYAVGVGTFNGDPSSLNQCAGDGIPSSGSRITYTTVNELRG